MKSNKIIAFGIVIVTLLMVLTACGGNKIDGTWVKYSDTTEKDKVLWEIDSKKNKLIVTSYADGEENGSSVVNISLDKKHDVLSQTRPNGQVDDLPFVIEDDTLTILNEKYYREDSKDDKEAKEKIKKDRESAEQAAKKEKEKADKEAKAEQEKKDQLIKVEEEYNTALDNLAKRVNKDFIEKYAGSWYKGPGFNANSTARYQLGYASKMTIKDDKVDTQDTSVNIGDGREIDKKDAKNYRIIGIQFNKKHEVTMPKENEDTSLAEVALPAKKDEIDNIKSMDDFLAYQSKNNIKEISFNCLSLSSNTSDFSIIINVNDPTKLYGDTTTGDPYTRDLPHKIEDTDFDI